MAFIIERSAATKRCPIIENRKTINCKCIGDECMAWRWNDDESKGFCGLCGVPD